MEELKSANSSPYNKKSDPSTDSEAQGGPDAFGIRDQNGYFASGSPDFTPECIRVAARFARCQLFNLLGRYPIVGILCFSIQFSHILNWCLETFWLLINVQLWVKQMGNAKTTMPLSVCQSVIGLEVCMQCLADLRFN